MNKTKIRKTYKQIKTRTTYTKSEDPDEGTDQQLQKNEVPMTERTQSYGKMLLIKTTQMIYWVKSNRRFKIKINTNMKIKRSR